MVYFVGAGPGASDLITVRGLKLLQNTDCVIYAGSLVNPELLSCCKNECKVFNSASMTLEEVVSVIKEFETNGKNLVRLHTGDPCLYGAIREQMDILDECGIKYEYVPGVSSFCAAASSLNVEYTLPDVSQSVVITRAAGRTSVPALETVESFAKHNCTMVLFLSMGLVEDVQRQLLDGGYKVDTPVAVVYKSSWPEERKIYCNVGSMVKEISESGINKTALIIVGEVLNKSNYSRSKLYDPEFETGFRKAKKD